MKKTVKLIAIVLISLVILLAIGLTILINTVDPNDYKSQISAQVQQITGRTLTINGNIQWSLFPWVGLKVADVTLSNPPGFGAKADFATVQQAGVSVRLLPLMIGKVDIGTLKLKTPTLHLITLANGKTNFDFSVAAEKDDKKTVSKSVKTPHKTSSASPMQINIQDLVIDDGSLVWDNQKSKQHVSISEFDLSGKKINTHKAFPMTLRFTVENKQPAMSARVFLSGRLLANLEKQHYRLSPLSVDIDAKSDVFSGGKLSFAAKTQLDIDLDKQTFVLDQLNSQIDDVNIVAKATGEQITSQPVVKGSLAITTFNPKKVMAVLGQKVRTKKSRALTKASIKTDFLVSKTEFDLNNLMLMLDDSRLTGYLDGNRDKHTANVNLQLDQINLDDYLPPKSKKVVQHKAPATTPATAKQTDASHATTPAWVKTLRVLRADGKLRIGQLQLSHLTLTHMRFDLKADSGKVALSPMQAQLYGGLYKGAINIDAQPAMPTLDFKQTLSDIDLGALTKALTGRSLMTGQLQFNLHANSAGFNSTTLLQNMKGRGEFNVNNGVFQGIDIDQQIRNIDKLVSANLTDLSQIPNLGKGQTAFSRISGTFDLKNGYASNQDFMLLSKEFQVTGQGRLNLVTQGIDYRLNIGAGDQGNAALFERMEKTLGVDTVPLLVSGTLTNPKVSPDLIDMQKQILKNKGKEMIQGAGAQLQNASQKLRGLIKF